jgi:AcrR family transcriptional regulator
MVEGEPEQAPEPGLRERKKQQMRRHIAETARERFAERGFDNVTVAEVAAAAEVSQQTVFNYFPTKEDLVFWRLGAFEAELLATIRDRAPGESALAAFARFLFARPGLLSAPEPAAQEQLASFARMIAGSPALLAREQQIFAGNTQALAELLAGELDAEAGDLRPWVAANAITGLHRALVAYARARVLEGARHPALGDEVRARAEQALALLEAGLDGYAAPDAPRR